MQGNRLILDRHCGDDGATISIVADPSLSHAIEVDGSAGNVSTNIDAITVSGLCHADGSLTIRVPPTFPVAVDSSAPGDTRLGDLFGPVVLHIRGQGDVDTGRLTGGLLLDNAGAGDVHVGALLGDAVLNVYGSGDLSIDRVDGGSVVITDTGAGDIKIGAGLVGKLTATLAASGDLDVGATVGGGEITSTGAGDASLARVLGSLAQTQTGSGDIVVHARGGTPAETVAAPTPTRPVEQTDVMDDQVLANLLMFGLIAVLAALLWFWWRRRRRGWVVAAVRDPRVAATMDRLDAIAQRVGRIEALVTSRDFELNRSFREMGD